MAYDFGGDANTPVQEIAPARSPATEKRLPHASTPAFFLMFHPLRWQFQQTPEVPEGEWLPVLGTMRLDVGVGAVDKGGDDSFARVEAARKGFKVLEWDLVPPGTKNGRYIAAYPARGPAGNDILHVTAWESPRHLGNRVLPSKVDSEGYRAWLRWLRDEGHVTRPSGDAITLQLQQQDQAIELLRGKADKHPHLQVKVDAEVARAVAMAASVDAPVPTEGTVANKAPRQRKAPRPAAAIDDATFDGAT